MSWSLAVNGGDVATPGLYVLGVENAAGAPERTFDSAPTFGRAGVIMLTSMEAQRILSVSGTLTTAAKTVAARVAAEDQLKDALRAGLVRLTRDDGSTTARTISGYVGTISMASIGHPVAYTDTAVTFTLLCLDAYWSAIQPTLRGLPTVATRYTLPLGTAPSTPMIRIAGPVTTPVLVYRDIGGAAVKTLNTGVTLLSTDYLDINMRKVEITKYTSGVASDALGTLTGDFPWGFDPQDGNWATSAWPTLEVTGAGAFAEALYWSQYL